MTPHTEIQKAYFTGVRRIALVANGAIQDLPFIFQLIRTYERIVAVDGGLAYCHQMGITPDLLIGDFDSVTPELLQQYSHVPAFRFPTEKDDTDLELALKAIDHPGVETIGLFGAMGNRVDHTLNNLNLLSLFPKIIIETETESVFSICYEKHIDCHPGQKLSLLPLNSPAVDVTTIGLQWELKNATLNQYFRSISNVCLGHSVTIKIDHGELICCLARASNEDLLSY